MLVKQWNHITIQSVGGYGDIWWQIYMNATSMCGFCVGAQCFVYMYTSAFALSTIYFVTAIIVSNYRYYSV